MKRWEAGMCSRYLGGDCRYVKGFCRATDSHGQHTRSQESRSYLSPEHIITGGMTDRVGGKNGIK